MSKTEVSHAPNDVASTAAWIGPFVVFIAWLGIDSYIPIAYPAKELVRDALILGAILFFSRRILPRTAPHWLASIALGIGVFVLWVLPDALFPAWRGFWLFQNSITG